MEGEMSVSIEWLGFAAITLSVLAYVPQITHFLTAAYNFRGVAELNAVAPTRYAAITRNILTTNMY
jgi:hypothetical protein